MLDLSADEILMGTGCLVLVATPFTNLLYFYSDLFEKCAVRLDVELTLICHMSLVGGVCGLALFSKSQSASMWRPFRGLLLMWLYTGAGLITHNLIAVFSCWMHFRNGEDYTFSQFCLFVIYAGMALIFAFVVAGFLLNIPAKDRLPFYHIWSEEQKLTKILLDWHQAHNINPYSGRASKKLQHLIRLVRNSNNGSYPSAIKSAILANFYSAVIFQVYKFKPDSNQSSLYCRICEERISEGERYSTNQEVTTTGPLHFHCFVMSPSAELAVQTLTQNLCREGYERLRASKSSSNTIL